MMKLFLGHVVETRKLVNTADQLSSTPLHALVNFRNSRTCIVDLEIAKMLGLVKHLPSRTGGNHPMSMYGIGGANTQNTYGPNFLSSNRPPPSYWLRKEIYPMVLNPRNTRVQDARISSFEYIYIYIYICGLLKLEIGQEWSKQMYILLIEDLGLWKLKHRAVRS